MSYTPGLHLLAELRTVKTDLLNSAESFRLFADQCIAELNLCKVGEAYHDFPGGGYTAVIALTESHLSIHTWPEYGMATFDVFLSNYQRDNDETTRSLFEMVRLFFDATVHNQHEVKR